MTSTESERHLVEPLEKLTQLQSDILAIDADTRLTDVLTAIAEAANDVLGGHFCVVQPYDQRTDRFLLDQFTPGGAPEAKRFQWREPRQRGTARTALEQGVLIVSDFDRNIDGFPFLAQGPGALKGAFRDITEIKACLGIRLDAGGETVGVLFVNYPQPRPFGDNDLRIAALFANQAALAIRNVRLHENLIRTSNNLSAKSTQLEQLLSLVREIDEWIAQRGGDKAELAEFTLNRFLDLFRFGAAWLQLMEGQRLRTVATDRQHVEDKGRWTRLDDSVTGLAASRRESIRIDDIATAEQHLLERYQPVHGAGMRSELAVPMVVDDRVVGVLNLESSEPYAFTADDQELLELLARHLGVAIVAAEEMQQRVALSRMAIEFSGSLDEDETARLILDRALKLVGGQFGQIVMRVDEGLEVTFATGGEGVGMRVANDDCASGLAWLPRDDPYLASLVDGGIVVLNSRSVIIPDVDKVARYKRVIEADKERMQSELAIPIESGRRVVGVFNVESPEPGAFGAQKERALRDFVQGHASTLSEALFSRDLDQLDRFMQQGLALVAEAFGQILRLNGSELVIEHTTGDEPVGTSVQVKRLESGQWAPVSGRAVMGNEIVNVADVSQDPGYERFLGEEMKSELIVPLVVQGETIGVINLESPVPGYFTEEHVQVLEPMASHAAAAMANAQAARERELAAVGEISGDIVHRLSNPAGAMRWRLDLIRQRRAELIDNDAYLASSLADIEGNVLKIQAMVRELKDGRPEPLAPFDVWPLVLSALERVDLPDEIDVSTQPGTGLPKVLTTHKLKDVFFNLITNAVEAMPQGGRLEVRADAEENGWAHVSIQDTGRGIPDYVLPEIFAPSFSTKEDEGHGLGLWWSKAFVERCGGTIEVQSRAGEGSCFTVRLRAAA